MTHEPISDGAQSTDDIFMVVETRSVDFSLSYLALSFGLSKPDSVEWFDELRWMKQRVVAVNNYRIEWVFFYFCIVFKGKTGVWKRIRWEILGS